MLQFSCENPTYLDAIQHFVLRRVIQLACSSYQSNSSIMWSLCYVMWRVNLSKWHMQYNQQSKQHTYCRHVNTLQSTCASLTVLPTESQTLVHTHACPMRQQDMTWSQCCFSWRWTQQSLLGDMQQPSGQMGLALSTLTHKHTHTEHFTICLRLSKCWNRVGHGANVWLSMKRKDTAQRRHEATQAVRPVCPCRLAEDHLSLDSVIVSDR